MLASPELHILEFVLTGIAQIRPPSRRRHSKRLQPGRPEPHRRRRSRLLRHQRLRRLLLLLAEARLLRYERAVRVERHTWRELLARHERRGSLLLLWLLLPLLRLLLVTGLLWLEVRVCVACA